MTAYVFKEHPKWVGDVIVENVAEERAHLLAVAVAVAQPSRRVSVGARIS